MLLCGAFSYRSPRDVVSSVPLLQELHRKLGVAAVPGPPLGDDVIATNEEARTEGRTNAKPIAHASDVAAVADAKR